LNLHSSGGKTNSLYLNQRADVTTNGHKLERKSFKGQQRICNSNSRQIIVLRPI
jgi:hypothetical protein